VLECNVFDNFVTLNGTAIVTSDLEHASYLVIIARARHNIKTRIEIFCNKDAVIVPDESNVNFERNIKRKESVNVNIVYGTPYVE
jgi:hypothetical protein